MSIDIEKLAREAGAHKSAVADAIGFRPDELKRFASLVLELAAQKCDATYYRNIGHALGEVRFGIAACAEAIRAMKPKDAK